MRVAGWGEEVEGGGFWCPYCLDEFGLGGVLAGLFYGLM